jgi:hypothetical protein
MRYFSKTLWLLIVAQLLFACGQNSSSSPSGSNLSGGQPNDKLSGSCGSLSFYNYKFPNDEFAFEIPAFKVAMNITGSFEGEEGWQNLTNDFDGQGLSMGLINQTLGTGSLQPLLIKARNQHMPLLKKTFSSAHLKSLLAMLKTWENQKSVLSQGAETALSIYDNEYTDGVYTIDSASSDSVRWARKNLYKWDGTFVPSWKAELQKLISNEEYVAIQIEAAWILHRKSLVLQESLGVFELRAYLLMFDIVVQNGNLYMEDWSDYKDWISKTPGASTTQKLEKIVELRMRHVKPQYVNNVRIRKMSLINGQGRVHGADRNYEREYCFDRMMLFPGT